MQRNEIGPLSCIIHIKFIGENLGENLPDLDFGSDFFWIWPQKHKQQNQESTSGHQMKNLSTEMETINKNKWETYRLWEKKFKNHISDKAFQNILRNSYNSVVKTLIIHFFKGAKDLNRHFSQRIHSNGQQFLENVLTTLICPKCMKKVTEDRDGYDSFFGKISNLKPCSLKF